MFRILSLSLTCFVSLANLATSAERPPNIIVLVADDLGYGDISVHGCKQIQTPNIDALAATGVRCTNGYVSCPYCSPTRAGLLTGKYQQRFGHEFNPQLHHLGGAGQGLSTQEKTIADLLRAGGYVTACIGKWHLGEEDKFHPLSRGFDEFYGFLAGAHSYFVSMSKNWGPIYRGKQAVELDGYLTDVLANEASRFFERNKDKPFFAYVAFNAVHTPMEAPKGGEDRFKDVADPMRRTYLAMTASLDAAVGTISAKLRELKLEENTLVFFISDNGGPRGKFAPNGSDNGPLRGFKGDTWEGGIRVPFLVKWPAKLKAGTVSDTPVIQLDILTTALAAAKQPIPAGLDGLDLLPILAGGPAPTRSLYWRFGEQMAIRKGDWKLVKAHQTIDRPFENIAKKPSLFNLAKDIGEKQDLADSQPQLVAELQADWDKWNSGLQPAAWPHHGLQKPKK